MADTASSGVKQDWLGRSSTCTALWALLVVLTITSVVPHWSRFSWEAVPLVPHVIETLIGPDVRGRYRSRSFTIFVSEAEVILADHQDPASASLLSSDFDVWDEIHSGWVQRRSEWHGLWWPSFVKRGYEVFHYNNASTQRVEVRRVVRDLASTIPWIGGLPERSTKATYFLFADVLMIVLTGLTFVSTRSFFDAKGMASHRNGQCCTACGYDLAGLPAPVCPECGTAVSCTRFS